MTDLLLFGFGALGTRLLRVLENDYPALNVVGVIDSAPGRRGAAVRDLCPYHRFGDVVLAPDLPTCLNALGKRPDVLVHMTESKPERIEAQLVEALEARLNVVSAAESMFYPQLRFPAIAERLDAAALKNGVTISGAGINPGFSYDLLPLLLARATSDISSIVIRRVIDVTGTGPGDIEHVGYGLTPEDFRAGVAAGRIVGHMGAPESLVLLAEYLDMPLDLVTEHWDLETADFAVDSGDPTLGVLSPGRVVGITQRAEGSAGGKIVLSTRLAMYYRPERFGLVEADEIEIQGAMPIRMTIKPALQSLFGAANVVASAVRLVAEAPPGLVNELRLPVLGKRSERAAYELDPARPLAPGSVPVRRSES